MVNPFEETFPGLSASAYRVTSPSSNCYNCIAWAAGDCENWWWPGPNVKDFWPPGVARAETLVAFLEAFTSLGYVACSGDELEPGFERIALFADAQGMPTHASRQLPSGRWTSKLGNLEDIEHALYDLTGSAYGSVVQIMKRPLLSH